MSASGVGVTSVTGGSLALVLSGNTSGAILHAAQYTDVWGTSGNPPWVDYRIHEFTDPSWLTLKQSEHGICPLTFSGGIASLNRAGTNARIKSTWVFGGGYFPSANSSSPPTYINFGTNSANICISIGPSAGDFSTTPPFFNTTNAGTVTQCDLLGWGSYHTECVGNSQNNTADEFFYFPFYVKYSKLYQSATITCESSNGAGNSRCAIYDSDGTGWIGNLRVDWVANGGSSWDFSSNGRKTSTMSSGTFLTAGWYGMGYVSNDVNGSSFIAVTNSRINPMGTVGGSHAQYAKIANTYGAFPSTAPASTGIEFGSGADGTATLVPVILIQ